MDQEFLEFSLLSPTLERCRTDDQSSRTITLLSFVVLLYLPLDSRSGLSHSEGVVVRWRQIFGGWSDDQSSRTITILSFVVLLYLPLDFRSGLSHSVGDVVRWRQIFAVKGGRLTDVYCVLQLRHFPEFHVAVQHRVELSLPQYHQWKQNMSKLVDSTKSHESSSIALHQKSIMLDETQTTDKPQQQQPTHVYQAIKPRDSQIHSPSPVSINIKHEPKRATQQTASSVLVHSGGGSSVVETPESLLSSLDAYFCSPRCFRRKRGEEAVWNSLSS
jgi:hypothetical protein